MNKSLRAQVVEFAIENKDSYSWKEIAEKFGLSTDDKTLKRLSDWTRFYKNTGLLEPSLSNEDASINMEVQESQDELVVPQGFKISKMWQNSGGKMLYSFEKEEQTISNLDLSKIAETIAKFTKPNNTIVEELDSNNSTKIFCISDVHVGMDNKGWNLEELNKRFLKLLNYTDNCEEVYVINFGDLIDGAFGETVRGGHTLPQNLNTEQQIIGAVNAFQLLFDGLAEQVKLGKIKTFNFVTVSDSNHAGEMEVVIAKILKMWLELKYPYVKVIIPEDFWGVLNIRGYNILISHGKDGHNMMRGVPLNLDLKTELLLAQKLQELKLPLDAKKTLVVSGDLHTMSFNHGKFFKYYKVPALSPSSAWVEANFGDGIPGVQYFNLSETKLETGIIEF